jgi:hypothetical protein
MMNSLASRKRFVSEELTSTSQIARQSSDCTLNDLFDAKNVSDEGGGCSTQCLPYLYVLLLQPALIEERHIHFQKRGSKGIELKFQAPIARRKWTAIMECLTMQL